MKKIFFIMFLGIFLFNIPFNTAVANEHQLIRDKLNSWVKNGAKQKDIGRELRVDPSTVSRFLDGTVQRSPKILRIFKENYPQEYQCLITPIQPQIPSVTQISIDLIQKPKVARKLEMGIEKKQTTLIQETLKQLNTAPLINTDLPPVLVAHDQKKTLPQAKIIVPELIVPLPSAIKAKIIARRTQTTTYISPKTPVVISYRDEGKVKGTGAFYDHYTIQRAINYPTLISHAQEMKPNAIRSYVRTITHNLPLGVSVDGKNIPEVLSDSFEGGLLIIPGRTRDNEYDPIRTQYEQRIIKEALKRGQPILSICAGSWQLWEAFGGRTNDVRDHCYRGGMMRVGVNGDIVCNKQIHRIFIEEDSLLSKTMGNGPHGQPTVNSLHWKAPDERTTPQFLRIVARAVPDNNIAPLSSTGNKQPMEVESNTVEAFEGKYGAPIMGILWHPEAYNSDDDLEMSPRKHINILKYMARSGHAYKMKRRMLRELEETIK